jgi:predicted nucleic acid-binding Zn ribbon protein
MPGLLQESLQSLGLAERLRDAEIWRVWNDAVGAVVAIRAQPLRIINGTLTVAVSSAPWMQELRFMTGMMKEKLNDRLGAEVVREIVLKAGRVDTPLTEEPQEKLHKKHLTLRQKALIDEHSSSISDPETRQAFAELMKSSFESQT